MLSGPTSHNYFVAHNLIHLVAHLSANHYYYKEEVNAAVVEGGSVNISLELQYVI